MVTKFVTKFLALMQNGQEPISITYNKTATASSNRYFPTDPSLAIRFQRNSDIYSPEKQCSGQARNIWMSDPTDTNPWLQVDLGQTYSTTALFIWNRNDCCWGRLTPFSITISDTNATTVGPTFKDQSPCFMSDDPKPPSKVGIYADCVSVGRYVIIRLTGPNHYNYGTDFHVCAIQVYGSLYSASPSPPPTPLPPPRPSPPPPSPNPPPPPSPSPSPPPPPSPSPPPYIPFPNTSYCPVGNPFYWTVTNTTYKTYGQMCIHTNPTNFTTIPCDFANGDNTSIGYLWNNSLKMQVFPLPADKCWGVSAGSLLVQVPCETAPTVTESQVPDFQPGNLVINGSCVTAGPLYSVITVSPCTSQNLSQTWVPVCSPFPPPPPPSPPLPSPPPPPPPSPSPPPPLPSPPPPPSPPPTIRPNPPPPPPSPSPPPPPSPSPPPPPSPSPPPPPSPSPPPPPSPPKPSPPPPPSPSPPPPSPSPPPPPSPNPPPFIPFPNTTYCPVGDPFYWTVTNTTYKT